MEHVTGIIVAAGSSSRMGGMDKQWALLGGIPVLARSLRALGRHPGIHELVAVVRLEQIQKAWELAERYGITKLRAVVPGGDSRQESVGRGVEAASPRTGFYCIHDGARPLVSQSTISACLSLAREKGACTAAVKVKDTIKVGSREGLILHTPDRDALYAVQTPQVFAASLYRDALARAVQTGQSFTDDCQLIERMGKPVFLAQGDYGNLKITTREDLQMAQAFLEEREGMDMRIGHGYDVHRFAKERPLILGGVRISEENGLLGHSDADVLLHAVMDALLGAGALGDIGQHFPDTDERYRGADSAQLLQHVAALLREHGFAVGNIDATVVAQTPKLAPYIGQMRENLARICGVPAGQVSVKATTEEGLGFTGAKEGMAVHAVCLIIPISE